MRLVAVSSLIAAASAGEPPHGTPGPRRRLQEKGLRVCIQKMIYDGYKGGNEDQPRGFDKGKETQYTNYEANRWATGYGFSEEPPQPDGHLSRYDQCQVRESDAGKCTEDEPSGCNPDAARVVAFLNVTFSGTPSNMDDSLVDQKVLVKQFKFGLTDASGQTAIFPEMDANPGSQDMLLKAQLKKCGFLGLGDFGYIRPSGGSESSSPTVDNGAELYERIPGTQQGMEPTMEASTKFDQAARDCSNSNLCEASSPEQAGDDFLLNSRCNIYQEPPGGCFGFALPVSFYIPLNASFPVALRMPQRPEVVFFDQSGEPIVESFPFDFDYVTDAAGECFEDPNGGAQQDPHLHFAHGGRADFRGQHGAYYNFFSAPGLAVNVKTEERTGGLPGDVPSRLVTRVAVNRTPPSCCTTASSRWTAPSSPRRTSSRAWVARSASGPTSPSGPRSSTARTGAGVL